jgi:hypothetical protein
MLTEGPALVDSAVAASTVGGCIARSLIECCGTGRPRFPAHFVRRLPAADAVIALAMDEKKGSGRNSAANIVLRL